MAWPDEFVSALKSPTVPMHLLFEVTLNENHQGVGQRFIATTDPGLPANATLLTGRDAASGRDYGPRIGPTGVTPQTWNYNAGAFKVTIHLDRPGGAERAANAVRKGSLCRLLLGFPGYSFGDYQPLRIGRINAVKSSGTDRLEVDSWDIVTAMRSRLIATNTDDRNRRRLFFGYAGQTDTLSPGSYLPGDTSISITGVAEDRFGLNSGAGLVKIKSTSGDWFYLTFTTVSSSTIGGLLPSGQLGTTANLATLRSKVRSVVDLRGHPVSTVQRLLTSTIDGGNGPYDEMPGEWGFGFDRLWVDEDQFDRYRDVILDTPSGYSLNWVEEDEIDDPESWLSSRLSQIGMWLCTRQGQFVIRSARDPNDTLFVDEQFAIGDLDLVQDEVPVIDWFDPEVAEPYARIRVSSSAGVTESSTNGGMTVLPAQQRKDYEMGDWMNGIPTATATAIRQHIRDRLKPWAGFVPFTCEFRIAGIRGFAPGDFIRCMFSQVRGRTTETVNGIDRIGMVTDESITLFPPMTRLRVAFLPIDSAEDYYGQ